MKPGVVVNGVVMPFDTLAGGSWRPRPSGSSRGLPNQLLTGSDFITSIAFVHPAVENDSWFCFYGVFSR